MIQLGDIIELIPETLAVRAPLPGKIVYIQQDHRYFTAEFTIKDSHIRESFYFCPEDTPEEMRPQQGCRTAGV